MFQLEIWRCFSWILCIFDGVASRKVLCCQQCECVLTDFLTTGIYDRNRDFIQTISPSMDILISSNLERLLYYASNKDTQKVSKWMQELNEKGRYQIDDETFKTFQNLFTCGSVDDKETSEEIKLVYDKTNYVLDPHSAIAYKVAKECKDRLLFLWLQLHLINSSRCFESIRIYGR